MNIDILKLGGIDVDSALEILGDIEMYNETLQDFLDEVKDRLPKLEEYKNKEDMQNYAILVHAMKSDSKYLGFKLLAELSYDHEMKSKENNIDYIKNNYDKLIEEANRIIDVAREYLKEN